MSRGHVFTPEDRQRGGWARCRQKAEERREKPTEAEQRARTALNELGMRYQAEYEIFNGRYPQFLDLLVEGPAFAIEVDGSHGWHDNNGKMKSYDIDKRRFLAQHNIPLLVVGTQAKHILKDGIRAFVLVLQNEPAAQYRYRTGKGLEPLPPLDSIDGETL